MICVATKDSSRTKFKIPKIVGHEMRTCYRKILSQHWNKPPTQRGLCKTGRSRYKNQNHTFKISGCLQVPARVLYIRYHVKDITLKELATAFISDFEMLLRTDKHCCTNTFWLYVCPLRTVVFIAINNEWLTHDPFRKYDIWCFNDLRI